MRLADATYLTLFPPARWEGDRVVVELGTLGAEWLAMQLDDEACDEMEADLRGIVARRLRTVSAAFGS